MIENDGENKNKIMIFTVGGSPEPIIFAINQYKPDFIHFIHSKGSKKDFEKVVNETKNKFYYEFIAEDKRISEFNLDYDFNPISNEYVHINKDYINYGYKSHELVDHENLNLSFKLSKDVLKEVNDYITKSEEDFEVIVDITGATKVMSSGLALAVSEGEYHDFLINYVGGIDRTKAGVGIVKDHHEINKTQVNPYSNYAVFEIKRGKNFFDKYQFDAALKNFQLAEEYLEDELDIKFARLYQDIVNFYDKWDKFEIEIDDEYSDDMYNLLEKTESNEDLYTYLYNLIDLIKSDVDLAAFKDTAFFSQMEKNLKFLSLKIRGLPASADIGVEKKSLDKRIKYYIPDLFANASRRMDEGKYDDALARLYRANELFGQYKLNKLGVINKEILINENEFHITTASVEKKANDADDKANVLKWVERNSRMPNGTKRKLIKVGNSKNYKLLEYFGEVKKEDYQKINEDLEDRHGSILAHGINPIRKQRAEDLFTDTLSHVRKDYSLLDQHMDFAKFPKFNEEI